MTEIWQFTPVISQPVAQNMNFRSLTKFWFQVTFALVGATASLSAATSGTVTPSTLTSNSSANITVAVTGLVAAGDSARVERILDLNGNGVADTGEPLVQSFVLTDGQVTSVGGVRNPNIPGDDDGASDGQITTHISLPASPESGKTAGSYVILISSPTGKFTAFTKTLAVTQPSYGQSASGQVTSGGSPVPYAIVSAVVPPGGDFIASVVSNSSGNFTLNLPAGSYALAAMQVGYVASMNSAPTFTLNASQTLTGKNPVLTAATCSISGKTRNLSDNSTLAGVQLNAKSAAGEVAITASDANGNYALPVTAGQWSISASDASMNALGYLRPNTDPTATATAGGTTALDLSFTPATSMVYGTVKTPTGVAMQGIFIESADSIDNADSLYSSNVTTDADGKYFLGMAGTAGWRIRINPQPALAPFIMPNNQWIDTAPGTATLVNLVAQQATAHLQGTVTKNGQPVSGVTISVSSDTNDVENSTATDSNGHFDIGVVPDKWWIGIDGSWAQANNILCPGPDGGWRTVIATSGQTITGIDWQVLDATGTITGSVRDPFNNPATNRPTVYAYTTINGTDYNVNMDADASGNYSLPVLSGYDWNVGADGCGDDQTVSVNPTAQVNFVQSAMISYPDDQTATVGGNATFSVTVTAPSPSFQWQRQPAGTATWSNITDNSTYSGATASNLTVHAVTPAMAGDQFQCTLSYTFNGIPATITSESARLDVIIAHLLGTVTKAGVPVPGFRIGASLQGVGTWIDADTDANGNFDLGATANGTWNFTVPGNDALVSNTVGQNLQATVTNSQNVSGLTFQVFDATGLISGSVKDAGGNPVTDTNVWANATINGKSYRANISTDSLGNYSLPVINGTWTVGVNSPLNLAQQTVAVTGSATVNFAPPVIVAHLMGTVTKNGTGVSGITLVASQNSSWVSATTDANGNFDLGVPATGTWNISVPSNFAIPHNIVGQNRQMTVTNGQNVSNIAFLIADGTGTVSGSVKNASGNPFANTNVWANATINGNTYFSNANTDVNGNYSFPVVTGTWTVGIGNAPNFAQQTVAVTSSATVNFTQRTVVAHLTGTVIKNGVAVSGATVFSDLQSNNSEWTTATSTANGSFDLGVTGNGTWNVRLEQNYASSHNLVGALLPEVVSNNQGIANIALQIADGTGTISGTVKDSSGNPLVNSSVYANATVNGGAYFSVAQTDASGNYSFPVINGTWTVGVNNPLNFSQQTVAVAGSSVVSFVPPVIVAHLQGQVSKNGTAAPGVLVSAWQNSGGISVTTDSNGNFDFGLTATGTWNIGLENNFELSHNLVGARLTRTVSANQTISGIALPIADATGTISGNVKDSGGNALANAGIYANATINGFLYFADATTDANGNYSLPVINGTWTVGVGTAINFPQQTITVTSSSQVNFTQRAIVAHLTGTVTKNGTAASGATVFAILQDNNSEWTTATSAANGSFDLGVTCNGTWNVSLQQNYANSNNLVGEILSEVVSSSQSIANIALHIADGTGTISGTVKDPNGNVLANISVYASATINGINFNANTQSEANGNYSFPVINGTWTVGVGNALNFAQQTVAVTGSAQVNLNQLAVVAHLQGTVTKNGVAAPGILVNAWQDSMSISVTTDANGYFDLGVTNTGAWNIALEYNYAFSHNLVGAILTKTVTQNQTISNLALQIADTTGTISGNVKDSNGNPLGQTGVFANATINGVFFFANTQTDNSGNYSLPVINGTWSAGVGTAANFPQQIVTVIGSAQANFTQLPVIAHLTGRVTKNGAGVSGIPVAAGYGLSGVASTTDANGYFDLGVTSNATWGVFVDSTYAASHNLFSPILQVAVTNNQNVSNIALQIADATGTVSGSVKDAGGNPLTYTGVYAEVTSNGSCYFVNTSTDGSGNYSFLSINGTWTLGVPNSLYFARQTVIITGSMQVNFVPAPVVAHLQGKVTKNGVGLSGVTIGTNLQGPGNNDIGNTRIETTTDNSGNFDLGVPGNGSWRVSIGSDYASAHNLVSVSLIENVINNQNITNIACNVVDGTGTISGVVKDSGGTPLVNMGVFAPATVNGENYFVQAQTDSNGNYSFPVINGTWTVKLVDANSPQQTVAVTGSAQVNLTLLTIVAHLQGRLTKNGAGVSGTTIDAWPQDGNFLAVWATTDANGYFDLGVTSPGVWIVGLNGDYTNANNLVGTNQLRTVTNNQTITSIPIQITDGTGSIYGTVRDSGNNPVTEVGILGTATVNGVTYSAHAGTDTNGNYSFPIINGTWTVSVSSPINFNPQTVTVNGSAQVNFAASSFAAWQTSWFTAGDIATGQTTPTTDFDRDGLPNLLEYAFGTNPKAMNVSPVTPNVSGNKIQISFPCDATCTDITYTVQASSNLTAWTDIAKSVGGATTVPVVVLSAPLSTVLPDSGLGQRTVTVTEAAPFTGKRFLRVKVTTP
jgi:uncharacterized GH25 family protein